MSRIRSRDTRPEITLRSKLHREGFRFRVDYKKLPGRPDIVLVKYKIAIFIDGEFWHGFDWESKKKKIATNRSYWIPKIERNIARDKKIAEELESIGFLVLRFWEREVKSDPEDCLTTIKKYCEAFENA